MTLATPVLVPRLTKADFRQESGGRSIPTSRFTILYPSSTVSENGYRRVKPGMGIGNISICQCYSASGDSPLYAICWQCNWTFRLRKRRVQKRRCPKCRSYQLIYVDHPSQLFDLGLRKGQDLLKEEVPSRKEELTPNQEDVLQQFFKRERQSFTDRQNIQWLMQKIGRGRDRAETLLKKFKKRLDLRKG